MRNLILFCIAAVFLAGCGSGNECPPPADYKGGFESRRSYYLKSIETAEKDGSKNEAASLRRTLALLYYDRGTEVFLRASHDNDGDGIGEAISLFEESGKTHSSFKAQSEQMIKKCRKTLKTIESQKGRQVIKPGS